MLRNSRIRRVTPLLHEMLNPTAPPQGAAVSDFASVIMQQKGEDDGLHHSQAASAAVAAVKPAFALRNLREASLFSTRSADTSSVANTSKMTQEEFIAFKKQMKSAAPVLSDTLRRLDKTVKRAVELEKHLTVERARVAAAAAVASPPSSWKSLVTDGAATAASGSSSSSDGGGSGREDLLIAQMLLGDADVEGLFGSEADQIEKLASGGGGRGDGVNRSNHPNSNRSSVRSSHLRPSVSSSPSPPSSSREIQRLEKLLDTALDEVRTGLADIGKLSTVGMGRVFEAILAKGQAVTALAILSKWLHDSHPSDSSSSSSGNTSGAGDAVKIGNATRIPLSNIKRKTLAFPFGDAASTGVNSPVDGSAFVSALPGRALISAAMIAAASYDREACLGFEAYREKQAQRHVFSNQKRGRGAEERIAPKSIQKDKQFSNGASSAGKRAGDEDREGVDEDEEDLFDSEGDLYVIELCRRWLCNPNAILHYRAASASAAAVTVDALKRAETETTILNLLQEKLTRSEQHAVGLEGSAMTNVTPLHALSESDEVILMILLAIGALNCRGTLPLVQKRFASLSSYSDRLQQLTEKVLSLSVTTTSHSNNQTPASCDVKKDNADLFSLFGPSFRGTVAGDRVAEIASALRQIDDIKRPSASAPPPTSSPSSGVFAQQSMNVGRGKHRVATNVRPSPPAPQTALATPPFSPLNKSSMDASDGAVGSMASSSIIPFSGLLTSQEQQTLRTIDLLQGRLAGEVEVLRRYAVRLIVRVFAGLGLPTRAGHDALDETLCLSLSSSETIRKRAEAVVSELIAAILHSCDNESPTAMSIAMSAHKVAGAVTYSNISNAKVGGGGSGGGVSTMMGEEDDEIASSDLVDSDDDSGRPFTDIVRDRSAMIQKLEKQRNRPSSFSPPPRMFSSRSAMDDATAVLLHRNFNTLALQTGVPMRPPPAPTPSSAAALGLLFPHKAWRAVMHMASLRSARRNDVERSAQVRQCISQLTEQQQQQNFENGDSGDVGRDSGAERLLRMIEGSASDDQPKMVVNHNQCRDSEGSSPALASKILKPTVSIYSDQLFLTAIEAIDAGLGVLISPPSAVFSSTRPSLRSNVAEMGERFHNNSEVNALSTAAAAALGSSTAPSLRAEAHERFDVMLRGVMSRVENGDALQAFAATTTPRSSISSQPFSARGVTERDAPLTSFPLQSQLVQFTMRDPTSLADKRHHSLFQRLTCECPSAHFEASSGLSMGLGSAQDTFEIYLWQHPDSIYSELVRMWRCAVWASKSQYAERFSPVVGGGSAASGSSASEFELMIEQQLRSAAGEDNVADIDTDNGSSSAWESSENITAVNFHLLRRWLQLACCFGNRVDGPHLFSLLRNDISGEKAVFKNFRHVMGKLMLSGMAAHAEAPLLFDAHVIPFHRRRERFGDRKGSIGDATGGDDGSAADLATIPIPSHGTHQHELALSTTFCTVQNGITIIGRDASVVKLPNNNDDQEGDTFGRHRQVISCPNPYTTTTAAAPDATATQFWEGIGYVERVLAVPNLLTGYLWADPLISMLGTAAASSVLNEAACDAGIDLSFSAENDKHPKAKTHLTAVVAAGVAAARLFLPPPSSSNAFSSSRAAADLHVRRLESLVLLMPAQWWQFAIANNCWELIRVAERKEEVKTVNRDGDATTVTSRTSTFFARSAVNSKAIVDFLHLIHLGTAVHGAAMVSNLSSLVENFLSSSTETDTASNAAQNTHGHALLKQLCLVAHYVGDGMGIASTPKSDAIGGLAASSGALVRQQSNAALPSLRVFYKLLLCAMASLPSSFADLPSPTTTVGGEEGSLQQQREANNGKSGMSYPPSPQKSTVDFMTNRSASQISDEYTDFDEGNSSSSSLDFDDDGLMSDGENFENNGNTSMHDQKNATNNNHTSTVVQESAGALRPQSRVERRDAFIQRHVLEEDSAGHLYRLLFTAPIRWVESFPFSLQNASSNHNGSESIAVGGSRLKPLFDASSFISLLLPIEILASAVPSRVLNGDADAAPSALVPTLSTLIAEDVSAAMKRQELKTLNNPPPTSALLNVQTVENALEEWALTLSAALQKGAGGGNANSSSNQSAGYTPFREARTHLLSTLAASEDPFGCLVAWALVGSRVDSVGFIGGGGEEVFLDSTATQKQQQRYFLHKVRLSLDSSHAMQPRHVVSLARMMARMGYRCGANTTLATTRNSRKASPMMGGQCVEREGVFTIDLPVYASTIVQTATSGTINRSDNDDAAAPLQLLWFSHIVPSALDGLAKCMLRSPLTRQVITDLTFGTFQQVKQKEHVGTAAPKQFGTKTSLPHTATTQQKPHFKMTSIPHEAVRYVFRDVLLSEERLRAAAFPNTSLAPSRLAEVASIVKHCRELDGRMRTDISDEEQQHASSSSPPSHSLSSLSVVSAFPSLQHAVPLAGARQPLMPNLFSVGANKLNNVGDNAGAGSSPNTLPEASMRVLNSMGSGLLASRTRSSSLSSSDQNKRGLSDLFRF